MNTNRLADKNGKTVGWQKSDTTGRTIIQDSNCRNLGSYNPKNNTTYDQRGRVVGTGNQLGKFLK